MRETLCLRQGELVRVRSEAEILATLDEKGELDGLPFMPEMLRYCGHPLRVHRRADKTCDTLTADLSVRRMRDAVHLENARCTGADHGGCQAACLIFWKEAWLERLEAPKTHPLWSLVADRTAPRTRDPVPAAHAGCERDVLFDRTVASPASADVEIRYRCQITQLLEATTPLSARSLTPYLRDWLSGNVALGQMLKISSLRLAARFVWGRGFRVKLKLYDALARLLGESAWPYHPAPPAVGAAPTEVLDLKPGDLVTVKSHAEILATLRGRSHRGLSFAPEMVRYCGGTYRVRARVEQILDERTGRMLRMKHDCIVLEDVVCRSECSANRLFCPRAIHPYWREIWLRRAAPNEADSSAARIESAAKA
jgi:hypothetical protein